MEDLQRLIRENQSLIDSPPLQTLLKDDRFWRKFIKSNLPQGHGSGLDADTLDGLHADDFLQRISQMAKFRGGGGASKFKELTDVPNSYTGQSGKFPKVKATEDGLEFGSGGGGVTDHGALTGLGDDDHTQYLLKSGGTMIGNLNIGESVKINGIGGLELAVDGDNYFYITPTGIYSLGIVPWTTNTYDLGSSTYKWKNLHLQGNITIDGTVDGVDVSSHAGNADAHHASGNIKDYTLGVKTGIKAGTNVTITDDGGYAKITAAGGGGGGTKLIRFTSFGTAGSDDFGGSGSIVSNKETALTFGTGATLDSFAERYDDFGLLAAIGLVEAMEFEMTFSAKSDNNYHNQIYFLVGLYFAGNVKYTDAGGLHAGFWLVYDDTYGDYGGMYNLLAITRNGTSYTLTDLGVNDFAPQNTFGIRIYYPGATRVEFYLNGTLVATHTTDILDSYPTSIFGISSQDTADEQATFNYLSVSSVE